MTISEIAKLAGVSSATVSRYFNNGYLSKEKKAAIAKVVEETGYRPSPQAQTLRTHRSRMVGVILPRIESNSIARIVSGIASVMNENGYRIILANTENNTDNELAYLTIFDNKTVDGVILVATVMTNQHREMITGSTIPIVVVGQEVDDTDCVFHDDYHAACGLTELMFQKGCQSPLYLGAFDEDRAVGHDRTKGFIDTAGKHGIEAPKDRVMIADFSVDSGCEVMGRLLEKYPDVDAVIAATDTIAVGAMQCLQKEGIRIPEDVILAGIGDSQMARVTNPKLTSMQYYYEESGSQSAHILLREMEKSKEEREKSSSTKVLLGYQLIERESTAREKNA
ncbi:MAG: LacI family DNA-binding transcriptional regulator [Eubacterium sp.]|nr:LacI family DNA-binding transcriptional regulator [Eubacterium sp.]